MARPADRDYYVENRTEHIAQGDIYRDAVEFPDEPEPFAAYGMVLNHTSGMLIGAPGTKGYKHPWRLVAPLFTLSMLEDMGLTPDQLRQMRAPITGDIDPKFMYLPPYPHEWEEAAVVVYRPVLMHQEDLDARGRVTQLQFPAAQQIQRKLLRVFIGRDFDEEDSPPNPDMTDHWDV